MRIVVLGFGVVGRSLLKLLSLRRRELLEGFGINPRVVAVVDRGGAALGPEGLDLEKLIHYKLEKGSVTFYPGLGREGMGPLDILEGIEAEVVVEATPTDVRSGEPGLTAIKRALRLGRHVITTNKGPLALAMPVLMELAELNGVQLKFSGTVGGGTPILHFAKKCLRGDRIVAIRGVLNGTTNYILCEMDEKGATFEQALDTVRGLGLAEADPSLDIDGIDSACKIVILANWVMGRRATLKDVSIRGIRGVAHEDFREASERGCTVRLIGSADDGLKVEPKAIARGDLLCVREALNAVTFISEYAGEETIVGKGAGGMETASAVLRDLLDISESLRGR